MILNSILINIKNLLIAVTATEYIVRNIVFLYKGKSFRYKDESDGKILLIDNSKNNGFELRLDYDEYGKWVNTSDGEKIIWTEEYWLHTKVPNNLYGLDENPAFKQSGEGIQYEFGFTILDLLKIKYLKEI